MYIIKLIQYLVLGLIQGFTEPIPVSSSGHLRIFKEIFGSGFASDLNFEIIVNFGSFLAIVLFFRKDILALLSDFFGYIRTKGKKYRDGFRYCLCIVIGTIPAGIAGFLFKDMIENTLGNVRIVGAALVITALFLYLIQDFKGKKEDRDITYKDAFIVGLFQMIALFPGISRSGATIVGAMLLNFKRETAFKFSFMLYLPISVATMVLGTKDLLSVHLGVEFLLYYLVGMVASFVMTFFATKWFQNIIQKGKLIYFVVYCLIVGFAVLLFL